jgi:hypothetical protein
MGFAEPVLGRREAPIRGLNPSYWRARPTSRSFCLSIDYVIPQGGVCSSLTTPMSFIGSPQQIGGVQS